MGNGASRLDGSPWEYTQGPDQRPIRVLFVGDDTVGRQEFLNDAHGRITAGLDAATGRTAAGNPVEVPEAVGLHDVVRTAWESLEADGDLPTETATLSVPASGSVLADERRRERFFEAVVRRCLHRRSVDAGVTIDVETIEGGLDRQGPETEQSADGPADHVDVNRDRPGATGFVVVVDGDVEQGDPPSVGPGPEDGGQIGPSPPPVSPRCTGGPSTEPSGTTGQGG
jgi:hypothetical protein